MWTGVPAPPQPPWAPRAPNSPTSPPRPPLAPWYPSRPPPPPPDATLVDSIFGINNSVSDDTIITGLWVNTIIGGSLVLLFCILQRTSKLYRYREYAHIRRGPPPLHTKGLRGFIDWAIKAITVSDLTFVETAGLDALIMVKVCSLGVQVFLPFTVIGVAVLLPLNWTGGADEASNSDSLFLRLTMSNIPKGSKVYWVHLVCTYIFLGWTMFLLKWHYHQYLTIRQHYLRKGEKDLNQWQELYNQSDAAQAQAVGGVRGFLRDLPLIKTMMPSGVNVDDNAHELAVAGVSDIDSDESPWEAPVGRSSVTPWGDRRASVMGAAPAPVVQPPAAPLDPHELAPAASAGAGAGAAAGASAAASPGDGPAYPAIIPHSYDVNAFAAPPDARLKARRHAHSVAIPRGHEIDLLKKLPPPSYLTRQGSRRIGAHEASSPMAARRSHAHIADAGGSRLDRVSVGAGADGCGSGGSRGSPTGPKREMRRNAISLAPRALDSAAQEFGARPRRLSHGHSIIARPPPGQLETVVSVPEEEELEGGGRGARSGPSAALVSPAAAASYPKPPAVAVPYFASAVSYAQGDEGQTPYLDAQSEVSMDPGADNALGAGNGPTIAGANGPSTAGANGPARVTGQAVGEGTEGPDFTDLAAAAAASAQDGAYAPLPPPPAPVQLPLPPQPNGRAAQLPPLPPLAPPANAVRQQRSFGSVTPAASIVDAAVAASHASASQSDIILEMQPHDDAAPKPPSALGAATVAAVAAAPAASAAAAGAPWHDDLEAGPPADVPNGAAATQPPPGEEGMTREGFDGQRRVDEELHEGSQEGSDAPPDTYSDSDIESALNRVMNADRLSDDGSTSIAEEATNLRWWSGKHVIPNWSRRRETSTNLSASLGARLRGAGGDKVSASRHGGSADGGYDRPSAMGKLVEAAEVAELKVSRSRPSVSQRKTINALHWDGTREAVLAQHYAVLVTDVTELGEKTAGARAASGRAGSGKAASHTAERDAQAEGGAEGEPTPPTRTAQALRYMTDCLRTFFTVGYGTRFARSMATARDPVEDGEEGFQLAFKQGQSSLNRGTSSPLVASHGRGSMGGGSSLPRSGSAGVGATLQMTPGHRRSRSGGPGDGLPRSGSSPSPHPGAVGALTGPGGQGTPRQLSQQAMTPPRSLAATAAANSAAAGAATGPAELSRSAAVEALVQGEGQGQSLPSITEVSPRDGAGASTGSGSAVLPMPPAAASAQLRSGGPSAESPPAASKARRTRSQERGPHRLSAAAGAVAGAGPAGPSGAAGRGQSPSFFKLLEAMAAQANETRREAANASRGRASSAATAADSPNAGSGLAPSSSGRARTGAPPGAATMLRAVRGSGSAVGSEGSSRRGSGDGGVDAGGAPGLKDRTNSRTRAPASGSEPAAPRSGSRLRAPGPVGEAAEQDEPGVQPQPQPGPEPEQQPHPHGQEEEGAQGEPQGLVQELEARPANGQALPHAGHAEAATGAEAEEGPTVGLTMEDEETAAAHGSGRGSSTDQLSNSSASKAAAAAGAASIVPTAGSHTSSASAASSLRRRRVHHDGPDHPLHGIGSAGQNWELEEHPHAHRPSRSSRGLDDDAASYYSTLAQARWGFLREAVWDGRVARLPGRMRYSIVSATFQKLFPDEFDRAIPVINHKEVDQLLSKVDWHMAQYEFAKKYEAKTGVKLMRRSGFCGLWGEHRRVRTYHRNKINALMAKVNDAKKAAFNGKIDEKGEWVYPGKTPSWFVFFRTQRAAAVAAQCVLHAEDNRRFRVHAAPGPEEVNWQTLWSDFHNRDLRYNLCRPFIVLIILFPIGIFTGGLMQLDYLLCPKDNCPPAPLYMPPSSLNMPPPPPACEQKGVEWEWYCNEGNFLSQGLKRLLTGWVPSLLITLWQGMVLPICFTLLVTASRQCLSLSSTDRTIARYVFLFAVFNVFLGGVIGSTIVQGINTAIEKGPGEIFSLIGSYLPTSSNYFINMVMFRAMVTVPLRMLWPHIGIRMYLLRRYLRLSCVITAREKAALMAPVSPRYGFEIGMIMLIFLITSGFAVVSPLILPFGILYFVIAWLLWRWSLLYVYVRKYESGGTFWPWVFSRVMVSLALFALFTGCVFITRQAYPQACVLFVTVPIILIRFNTYCYFRFQQGVDAVPLEAAVSGPAARVDPWVYMPPPLLPSLAGWNPDWGKVWQGWNMPLVYF
ncbi:hypothetical protein HYH03_001435 [Edaphochlamys debaryana]|uniref:CSC1/OSCA1-like 7TM region domain-containing protein n=1 Tax=Edaphochlamys debaryana TaxID=47281 RepID=A0A835YF86_9CHLO|nr:hypothetical protein HYH03_001435 [Edaphochlamys debaryana]|eukprot:KAG2500669.1 hypothetical protein HYH03_001435 [Edaphochlamys debaryana]